MAKRKSKAAKQADAFVEVFEGPNADALNQQAGHYRHPGTVAQVMHPLGVCEYLPDARVCKFCSAKEPAVVIPPSDESVG